MITRIGNIIAAVFIGFIGHFMIKSALIHGDLQIVIVVGLLVATFAGIATNSLVDIVHMYINSRINEKPSVRIPMNEPKFFKAEVIDGRTRFIQE